MSSFCRCSAIPRLELGKAGQVGGRGRDQMCAGGWRWTGLSEEAQERAHSPAGDRKGTWAQRLRRWIRGHRDTTEEVGCPGTAGRVPGLWARPALSGREASAFPAQVPDREGLPAPGRRCGSPLTAGHHGSLQRSVRGLRSAPWWPVVYLERQANCRASRWPPFVPGTPAPRHVVAVATTDEGVAFGFCFLQSPHSTPLSCRVIAMSPVDWFTLYIRRP